MTTLANYLYYYLGYAEDEIKPDQRTIRQRHMVMRQILDTGYKGLRLKSIKPQEEKLIVEHPIDDFKLVVRRKQKKYKRNNQKRGY